MTFPQLSPLGDIDQPVDQERIRLVSAALRAEGPRLARLTTARIAARIGKTAAAWLAPDSPWMDEAVTAAAETAGFSAEMLHWSLGELVKRLTPRSLAALVEAELGTLEPFQEPRNREHHPCARAANPPSLVFQVLAGTVPPVAIETIVLALLVRAPLLLKTSSDEPAIARVFLRSLRVEAPDLARHVAVMTWPGGDPELDRAACEEASIVAAYGGDPAVNALMSHCRFPTRFHGYGHRVSFAVIGPRSDDLAELALDRVVEDLALDASAYDQRGCMSPHCVFVSRAARWRPEDVAQRLAEHGFPTVARRLPRGRVPIDVAAAVQQARGVGAFTGRAIPTEQALVILHDDPAFRPSPGARTLHVVPYDSEEDLLRELEPVAGSISTVGLMYPPTRELEFTARLGRLGALRICRLGRMQRPIWLRDHDGRPRIGDWVDWTDVEPLY